MRGNDAATARLQAIFADTALHALMNQPMNLALQWALEQIGRSLNLARVAYLRSGPKEGELYLAAGWGKYLPLIGSDNVHITPEQYMSLRNGGWLWVPTKDLGWDALYGFHSNGHLCVLALDDPDAERVFTIAESECLKVQAEFFDNFYEHKKMIQRQQAALEDNTKALEEARRQASTDALTGLANQRRCVETLNVVVEAVMSGKVGEACLTMIDLDDFKAVNDKHGHAVGDKVLKALADVFRSGQEKFYGRYGGEEFFVITYMDKAKSQKHIEELLQTFNSIKIETRNGAYRGTFSAGLFEIRRDTLLFDTVAQNADLAYTSADYAMYTAKKAGKNRIVAA